MATTKKTTIIETDGEQSSTEETQPVQVIHEQPVVKAGLNNQTIITIAIVSSVVLFFIGLGLGYLLGNTTTNNRFNNRTAPMMQGIDQDDMGNRRGMFYQMNPDSSTNTNGQTSPRTQSN